MTETNTTAAPAVTLERLPGNIALVTINRPEARNAINGAVAQALDAIVAETEADPKIFAVVLTGAGNDAFCAGADLKEISAGRGATLSTEKGGFAGFVYAERSKPWIAAVKGKALAGGTELTLACDLVVAAEDSEFGLPEVLRGLIAGAGGLFRLPRAIPANIALELVLTAERLSAKRGHELGWINHLAPTAKVLDEALALAGRITRNAPTAVRESLKVVRAATAAGEAELKALTRACSERNMASGEYKEGTLAFIEKRAPRWTAQ